MLNNTRVNNTTQIINTKPAHGPMDLDVGQPSPRAALLTSGLTIIFMLLAALGAWVGYLFIPQYGEWTFPRFTGAALGTAIAVFGLLQSSLYTRITWYGWKQYYNRLQDWHETMLNAFEATDGIETTMNTDPYALSCDVPHHVLIAALVIHQRITASEQFNGRMIPYSRKGLEQALYLSAENGSNLLKVGELLGTQPERMGNRLAALGLITGRGNQKAGHWVPNSEREIIELLARNWHRLTEEKRNRHDH